MKSKKDLYYIFPEVVANLLFDYLEYHEKKYNSIWLFPSHRDNNLPAKIRNLQNFLTGLNLNFKCRTHKFRHSIATFRRKNKFPLSIRESLSNHAITSIEDKSYATVSIEQRREEYDTYFPIEYRSLISHVEAF